MKDSKNSSGKERLEFEWEGTGKCEVDIVNDLSATVRFYPSDEVIENTLQKLTTDAGKRDKG